MWFWFAITAGLASAVDKVLNAKAIRGKDNVLVYSFLYLLLISIFSFSFSLPFAFQVNSKLITLAVGSILFWSLGTILSFLSQAKTDISLVTIISRARVLWLIPLGYFFLHERLTINTIVGIVIIFLGFVSLLYKNRIHKIKGVHLMALGSICTAVGSILNTILVRNY